MTIQSAVTESRDPLTPGPKFTKKFTDRANGLRNVIIIDEASMLANKDFERVIQAAKAEGYKIVFMGDPKQIPEVTPGAKTKELAKAFANPNKSTLTNVFRTKDNNILTVLTNIRNNSDFVEYEFESSDNMKQLGRAAYNEELINDLQNNLEDVMIIMTVLPRSTRLPVRCSVTVVR
jgi:ATP-dependent exoDNAse (exonuclease V) alpha subunit